VNIVSEFEEKKSICNGSARALFSPNYIRLLSLSLHLSLGTRVFEDPGVGPPACGSSPPSVYAMTRHSIQYVTNAGVFLLLLPPSFFSYCVCVRGLVGELHIG